MIDFNDSSLLRSVCLESVVFKIEIQRLSERIGMLLIVVVVRPLAGQSKPQIIELAKPVLQCIFCCPLFLGADEFSRVARMVKTEHFLILRCKTASE